MWNGTVPVRGFFEAIPEGASINELELLAALHGLRHFVSFARNRSILLVSHSAVTAYIFRNMTSRS